MPASETERESVNSVRAASSAVSSTNRALPTGWTTSVRGPLSTGGLGFTKIAGMASPTLSLPMTRCSTV